MLKPSEFGLPEHFTEFRPNQLETAAKIAASTKFCYMLDSPTGTGKSLIAAAVQRLLEKKVVYVCTTKQLQQQLLRDFPYARTLMGRNNYRCLKYSNMYPRITSEECTNKETDPCEQLSACPYMIAKREALSAPLAILNTSYFLTEANYVGTFSEQDMIVLDEGDSIEDSLMSYVDVTLAQNQLDQLQLDPPRYKTKFESWVDWANEAVHVLNPRLKSIQRELEGSWTTVEFDLMKEEKRLARLLSKLTFFIREVDKNWVWYPSEDRWSFKPTWVAKYAEQALWKHAKKVLIMSATILDYMQVSRNIGLDVMKVAYKALPSPFPKENRPVYLDYAASVTNKTMQEALPKLVVEIRKILDDHPDDHILVHCVTYKIRDYLAQFLDKKRIMTHSTFDRENVLEAFKKSPYPKVLLSPSMDRGVDLPGEECRVVIIAKVPWPDLGDPQINKRVHASRDGNTWYCHKAISKIIQMAGRAVRSKDDYADCVTLDSLVLCADLVWYPIGALSVGDKVLCFDDYAEYSAGKKFRYWRVGSVVATGVDKRLCYTISLANGTKLTSTGGHKWLATKNNSVLWTRTKDLYGDPISLTRYIKPWQIGSSYAHGWLSGFADGEGTYSRGLGKRNSNVQHITLVQNPGPVMEHAKELLCQLGFGYGVSEPELDHLHITGGIEEKLRFLGEVRPLRLLRKFQDTEFSSMLRAMDSIPVVGVSCVGFKDVATLQVDKGTYFVEGFGAHNTYILDEKFDSLYHENKRMFPKWFAEAIVK